MKDQTPSRAIALCSGQVVEKTILVRAGDDHVILPDDSIDQPCWSHRGTVMAPTLAVNVCGAVGQTADAFNHRGHQVWTPRLMLVQRQANGRETIIDRREP